jgi:hypothetical protein
MNACPALDLIANHYADVHSVPVPSVIESLNDAANDDDDDDDDFHLIQIEVVSDFSLPK